VGLLMKKRVWKSGTDRSQPLDVVDEGPQQQAAVVDDELVGLDLVCDSCHMYDTEYKSTAGDSQNSM
jgi:hypothetical protein